MSETHQNAPLLFTGERYTPEQKGDIWAEHHHRYAFVRDYVANKEVLDAGCGEGYGTALMAAHARSIVGIDISAEAVAHASERYQSDNLSYQQASVCQIPMGDNSKDVIISFEVIEHLYEQEEMLAELARILKDDGHIIISSPDKTEYSTKRDYANEYHVKELSKEEFRALLSIHFPHQQWYAQRMMVQSCIYPADDADLNNLKFVVDVANDAALSALPVLPLGMYWLVVASKQALKSTQAKQEFRALVDADEQLISSFYLSERKRTLLESHLLSRENHIAYLDKDLRAHNERKVELISMIEARDQTLLERHRELTRVHNEHEAARIELDRREALVEERDQAIAHLTTLTKAQTDYKNELEKIIVDARQQLATSEARISEQERELAEIKAQNQAQIEQHKSALENEKSWRGIVANIKNKLF